MTNVISISQAYQNAEDRKPNWADPMPLPLDLPPVPAFDPLLLPTELRPWIEDITERLSVPMDFLAIPAMVGAASLIGAKVGVRPQLHTDWTEAANLWGVIVAEPGAMKTPAISEVLAPIRRLDARSSAAFENESAFHEDELIVHKFAREAAERRAKKKAGDGDMIAAQHEIGNVILPKKPVEKRFLVNNFTVEKLGEICADNPDGLLVFRDELLTLLSELEREEQSSARGFLLEAWGGSASYIFDRMQRGTIRIPRVNLSMIGTTQPSRLAQYIRASLAGKNDGMTQRLQLLAYPDMGADWHDVDRHPHSKAREDAFGCFDRLAGLSGDSVGADRDAFDDGSGIPFLRFEKDAVPLFVDYRGQLEPQVRGADLSSAMASHMSKYRGLIPRLALVHHLASGGHGPISTKAVETALEWAKYLEAHAHRAYGSLAVDSGKIARTVWRRIEKGDLQDGFTERDIYNRKWSNLSKGPGLTEGLKILTDCDWLSATTVATGGRPSTVFRINPKATGNMALAA